MQLHQKILVPNEKRYKTDPTNESKIIINKDEPQDIELTYNHLSLIKEWPIQFYQSKDRGGKQKGHIKLYEIDIGPWIQYYLECCLIRKDKDIPFLSILSLVDQWGTYHTTKTSDIDSNTDAFCFAQEWGTDSFLKAFSEATQELYSRTEPDKEEYLQVLSK